MLRGRHSSLANMLAGILAAILGMNNLLPPRETHAQQPQVPAEQVTATSEPAPGALRSINAVPPYSTDNEGPPAATYPLRMPTWLRAVTLPALGKLTPLDKAYIDAYSILREDNDCSRFYGGPRAVEVLNQLKLQLRKSYFDSSIGLRMQGKTSYTINNLSGVAYRLFEKAELNVNGPFYKTSIFPLDATIPRVGEFSPNTREARLTILLHELGHLIMTSENAFVLPNDGNDPMVSKENTTRVIEVCRRQIKKQSQTSFAVALAELQTTPAAKGSQVAIGTAPKTSTPEHVTASAP